MNRRAKFDAARFIKQTHKQTNSKNAYRHVCITKQNTWFQHMRGGSVVGRWTRNLQVAGSIPGRWLSRNIGQLSLSSLRGR